MWNIRVTVFELSTGFHASAHPQREKGLNLGGRIRRNLIRFYEETSLTLFFLVIQIIIHRNITLS